MPSRREDILAKLFATLTSIRLNYLDGDAESYGAIEKALTRRGSQVLKLGARQRPFVTKDFGWKNSGSTRKKLRQHWNRLSKLGAADIVNERTHAAAMAGFAVFLALEAASWKGERGTALQNSKPDEAFVTTLVSNLAASGNASVALLRVDGRPIAAQVLLYCGTTAYTWKTAFDAAYGEYSPGAVLVDRLTDQFLSAGSIEAIESCSPLGGYLGQLWDGRRSTIDMLVDVAPRNSLNFVLVAAVERGYIQLRELRNKIRALAS